MDTEEKGLTELQGNSQQELQDMLRRAERELNSTNAELRRVKVGAINKDFVQLSKLYLDETIELSTRAPAAHKLLMTLVKHMNKTNAVMISNESLVKLTRMSESTIKRAIKLLREQHWLDVVKLGPSNVYRVNSSVFWQDRADGKWAAFQADLIVNFDEQDAATKKRTPRMFTRHIPLVEAHDALPEETDQASQGELDV